ncbi:hypothetical protein AAVH_40526 [Aphelenchoides avenae]|nr:hypothetical protein AAVH_40526 [Aphelenchus avenae]
MATHDLSIPIVDGFVSKSFAAFLSADQDQTGSAIAEDLPPQYKFHGCINQLGVPSSYLPPNKFQPILPSASAPIALSTFEQLA